MKTFKTSKMLLPELMEVLNRSKYDGKKIVYNISTNGKKCFISFEQDISGNFFHTRVEEALALHEERACGSSIPFVTKRVADNPQALRKVQKRYGKKSYITK